MITTMRNLTLPLSTGILAVFGAFGVSESAATHSANTALAGDEAEFDEFNVFIEINATDGDAGFQGMLDGGPWERARVKGPDGRALFTFNPQNGLEVQGATEIAWESAEPQFDQGPLDEFLDRFPEGEYTADGLGQDGCRLESSAEFTHNLPAGPVITSHDDGDEVELDGENLLVTWDAVTDDFRGGALDSEIEMYIVVVEFEGEIGGAEVALVIDVETTASVTTAEIPADFFLPGQEYKIEVGAVEESGNATFTELTVCTVE